MSRGYRKRKRLWVRASFPSRPRENKTRSSVATVRITFTRTFAAIVLGSGGNGLPARRKSPRGTLTEEERAKAGDGTRRKFHFTWIWIFFFFFTIRKHIVRFRFGKIVPIIRSKKFREATNLSNSKYFGIKKICDKQDKSYAKRYSDIVTSGFLNVLNKKFKNIFYIGTIFSFRIFIKEISRKYL